METKQMVKNLDYKRPDEPVIASNEASCSTNHLPVNAHSVFFFECHICHLAFKYKISLKCHIKTIHPCWKIQELIPSDSVTDRPSNLKKGLTNNESTPSQPFKPLGNSLPSVCSNTTVNSKENSFNCAFCDYTCSRREHFDIHMVSHSVDRPYECDICKSTFKRKSELKNHIMIHLGVLNFKCLQCDYKCLKSCSLKRHALVHTKEKPFQCDVCKLAFKSQPRLKQHSVVHSGVKHYRCTVCDFGSHNRSGLKRHFRIHIEGKDSLECVFCKKRFHCDRYLKRHLLTQSCNKEYNYKQFDSKFVFETTYLKNNMFAQTKKNLFECGVCNLSFKQKSHLSQHILVHTGIKQYKCNKCEFLTTNFTGYKDHAKTHREGSPLCVPFVASVLQGQEYLRQLMMSQSQ